METMSSEKRIRKTGTAAKEIIMILREMSKYIDITRMPSDPTISDLLTPEQIEKIKKRTGLEFDNNMRIKLALNNLKFGGLPTNDKQRQQLKALGIMNDRHIKKLEGKISRAKRGIAKQKKNDNEKKHYQKRELAPAGSVADRIIQILIGLDKMGIDMDRIRQIDTLKDPLKRESRLEELKKITGIEDIDFDFRIGMYISNLRQGNIRTDNEQREQLRLIDVFSMSHIIALQKRERESEKLREVMYEIEDLDMEEEEIKNELARIKARARELRKNLRVVEKRKDNAKTRLNELNSKNNQPLIK